MLWCRRWPSVSRVVPAWCCCSADFLLLGLQPGVGFLEHHADIAVALALVLAIANVFAVIVMFAAVRVVVALLNVRGELLAGPLLVLVLLGAYRGRRKHTRRAVRLRLRYPRLLHEGPGL